MIQVFFQIGSAEESLFYGTSEDPDLIPSYWNKYPTAEDPTSLYKFTSAEIFVNPDLR